MHGGKQQFSVRAGTLPVPLIIALAESIKLATEQQEAAQNIIRNLQKYLLDGLKELEIPILINSPLNDHQSPAIVNFSFPPVEGEVMLHHLEEEEIYVGMGSACSAHSKEPSKILIGIGLTDEQARCSLRVSFSRHNTINEVEKFLNAFKEAYRKLLPTFIKRQIDR